MDYSIHMLVRSEHNLMVKSLPRVPDYGYPMPERKGGKQHRPVLLLRPILTALLHIVTK